MDRLAFVDIGELGWSLYLSAHMRWLKRKGNTKTWVIALPDRHCLYEGLVDHLHKPPDDFYKRFNLEFQSVFKLTNVSREMLEKYFTRLIPKGFNLFKMFAWPHFFKSHDVTLYQPYQYKKRLTGKREILVFPRARMQHNFRPRNLPKGFYVSLITRLCDEFPECTIRTTGISSGAYKINEIQSENYVNGVSENSDLQNLIDHCQLAVAAVGSQSAPPKITLLQGVPTFMIGHQKGRHVNKENWMGTKAGFYEIGIHSYAEFDFNDCIHKTISFMKEIQ